MTFSRLDEEELIELLRQANREEEIHEIEEAEIDVEEQFNEQEAIMDVEERNVGLYNAPAVIELFNEQERDEGLNNQPLNNEGAPVLATQRRSTPTHPPSRVMVMVAITSLKKRNGCTVSDIQYIDILKNTITCN